MKTLSEVLYEENKRYLQKIETLEALHELWPLAGKIERSIPSGSTLTNIWFDCDINIDIYGLTKKQALIFFDEVLWLNLIDTSDPFMSGSQIISYTNGGPDYNKRGQKIRIAITIVEGDGCYKVQTGTEELPVYEWRCVNERV